MRIEADKLKRSLEAVNERLCRSERENDRLEEELRALKTELQNRN